MGALSGVSVMLDPVPGTQYRLCAGATCTTSKPGARDILVQLPDSVGARRTTVHLTGKRTDVSKNSKLSVDETAQVTLKKAQPNGPQCTPTVFWVALRYEPGKGLVESR